MNHKKILVIATGGTIDALYDPAKGTPDNVPMSEESAIPTAIDKIKARHWTKDKHLTNVQYDFYQYRQRDSKELHTADMQHIAHYIAEHDYDYDAVIITHGTDTMPVHARKLKSLLAEYEIGLKTVIFTGAMSPLRDDEKGWRLRTDGIRNLKIALNAAIENNPGCYIAIKGKLRDAEILNKERELNEDGTVKWGNFIARDPSQSTVIIP